MAKDVKNQNKPMYQVHCTECGELIENKFFPLNQLLKQYYLGPQSQERIAEIVDFLGVGALYGQAVLPEVPAFVDQDGRWNFNKPVSFAQNAPAEFTCSDNAIPKHLLVDVNLNVASMVAQFCMITGFEDIYPMLKLRHEMDAKLRDYQDPSEEQNTRWREYCNKISWIPGVKIDSLLTPDKRYNLIGVLMSDILNFAEQEAKIPGRRHFAAQKLKIGWRYREENQRKMPVALVVRGESKGSFDALDCCCDKCRRPLLWDMGAYPQKVIGILGTQGVGKTTYLMALTDMIPDVKFENMTITHDNMDPQRKRIEAEDGLLWMYQHGFPPEKTAVNVGKAPALTFRVQKDQNTEPIMYTLADIPGEAFDAKEAEKFPQDLIAEIRRLLLASDSLILVVNSQQLREATDQAEAAAQANKSDLVKDSAGILSSIKEYLPKRHISTAVVLTAADMLGNLRKLLGVGYDISQIQPIVYSEKAKKYVYNAEMMNSASRTVGEYLDDNFGRFMHNLTASYVPEGSSVSAFLASSGTQYAVDEKKADFNREEAKERYIAMRNARFGVTAPLLWLLTCEGLLEQGRADAFFDGYDEKVRRRILKMIN